MESVRMGKRLKVGETFLVKTRLMCRGNSHYHKPQYKRFNSGDKSYFQKGKRKYYCEVLFLQETKVGWHVTVLHSRGTRYWQFTYLVKVIQS